MVVLYKAFCGHFVYLIQLNYLLDIFCVAFEAKPFSKLTCTIRYFLFLLCASF